MKVMIRFRILGSIIDIANLHVIFPKAIMQKNKRIVIILILKNSRIGHSIGHTIERERVHFMYHTYLYTVSMHIMGDVISY